MAMEREEKTFLRAMAYVLIAFVLMVWALWLLSPKQAAQAVAPGSAAERRGAPATASARVAVEPDFAPSQAVEGPADPIIVRTMAQLPLVENGFEVVGPTSRKPSNPAPGQRYLDTDLNTYSIYNGTSWLSVNTSAGIGLIDDIGDVGIDDAQIGDFLGWDGSRWTDLTVGIADLDDVDLTGIGDNQYLSYASATHKWVPVSLSTDDLSNFNLTSLADNQFIRYDSGTNKLVNETVDVPADAGYFVVTEYGAIADDGLDDRTGINACIDAAEAFTLAGVATKQRAVVVFPRGVYHMTTPGGIPLQIEGDRITVQADGATLTKSANGAENQLLYIADTAEDVIIDGLTVDGKNGTYTSSGEGLGINVEGDRCELRNCVVLNSIGSAIVDQIGASNTKFTGCKTFDTGRHGFRTRGNNCHILDCYCENWNTVDDSGGGPAILADSKECDSDELHIERTTLHMTGARKSSEAILIDPGDGDLSDATDDYITCGAATQAYTSLGNWMDPAAFGRAAWTIDPGHGYVPGDPFVITGSGVPGYDGASLWMGHKVIAVTGRLYCRSTGTNTLTLHPSAEDAQANTNAIDLVTSAGTGTFQIKAVGANALEVDTATGVDLGTNTLTTSVDGVATSHGFRTGAEVFIVLDHKTNTVLPTGLSNTATITTNTAYSAAGSASTKYRHPKRYRKVTIREVDIDYISSTTTADAAIKTVNICDLLMDRVTVRMAGNTSSGIDDTSLQFGNSRSITLRDCWFGNGLRNNVVSWVGNIAIDRCHIGMDCPSVAGIEALQCGRFAMLNSTIRFVNYGITTGGVAVSDPYQFRDKDCEELRIEGCVFECANRDTSTGTTRGLVIRATHADHLTHSGILKYTGNDRRHVLTPRNTTTNVGYWGKAFTVTGSPATVFTCTNHLLSTGDVVFVVADSTSGGFVPAGMSAGTAYFFKEVTRDTFSLYPSFADLIAGTNIVTTGGDGTAPYYLVNEKLGVGFTSNNNRDAMFRQIGNSGREFISSEAPSNAAIAYRAGDKIWKPDPVSGASPGWVVTKTGLQGTTAPTFTAMPALP